MCKSDRKGFIKYIADVTLFGIIVFQENFYSFI
jgi:hypothetical protein